MGKDNVTDEMTMKVRALLEKESRADVMHDMTLAPEWIRKIMKDAL